MRVERVIVKSCGPLVLLVLGKAVVSGASAVAVGRAHRLDWWVATLQWEQVKSLKPLRPDCDAADRGPRVPLWSSRLQPAKIEPSSSEARASAERRLRFGAVRSADARRSGPRPLDLGCFAIRESRQTSRRLGALAVTTVCNCLLGSTIGQMDLIRWTVGTLCWCL